MNIAQLQQLKNQLLSADRINDINYLKMISQCGKNMRVQIDYYKIKAKGDSRTQDQLRELELKLTEADKLFSRLMTDAMQALDTSPETFEGISPEDRGSVSGKYAIVAIELPVVVNTFNKRVPADAMMDDVTDTVDLPGE